MKDFLDYVDQNAGRFVDELERLCRQPSIAAQNLGTEETAQMVLLMLERIGAQAQLARMGGGPPVVHGSVGDGPRTLLFYNHYDVKAPGPLEQWESDPFGPEVRDGILFARGVADNKGDFVARVMAIEAYQATRGELPLRVRFVCEGEEEIGSEHLGRFVEENVDLLGADGCIWEGAVRDISGRPVLYLGAKGILNLELRVTGANRDLHSAWATVVPSPAWRLVWALASLKGEDGRLTVDGLAELVGDPPEEDLDVLARIPFEEKKIMADFGIAHFVGDVGGTEALKRHLYWPTCNISGLRSGYMDEGSGSVLPRDAAVRLDLRLGPGLDPGLVLDLVRQHLGRRGFDDIEIVETNRTPSAKSPLDAPIVLADVAATRTVFREEPVIYPLMAGAGPMYLFTEVLGIPTSSGIGVTHALCGMHAPNENIRIADYIEGIKYIGVLMEAFAEEE